MTDTAIEKRVGGFTVRAATREDVSALRRVMEAAIEELQRGFLSADQIAASHAIMGVDTTLVDDGTYLVVESGGRLAGCGGWSRRATVYGGDHTGGRDDSLLDPATGAARVRAMYTDPRFARRGVGRLILDSCQRAAAARGFRRLELVATMAGEPLYRSFGFELDEAITDDTGGVGVPLARMSKTVPDDADPIAVYRGIFALPAGAIAAAAARCLTPEVVFESSRLDRPLVGREAVVERIEAIARHVEGRPVARTTPIQWAGSSARWCRSVGGADGGGVGEGTDVVTLAADGRIARLAVFAGQVPPSTGDLGG